LFANLYACIEQVETEIDNLRGAFTWSVENGDTEIALRLASSLEPLWMGRGRIVEALTWFETRVAVDRLQGTTGPRTVSSCRPAGGGAR